MAEELSLVIDNPGEESFIKTISWNKEEFMDKVASITAQYEGLAYTEEQMKSAKNDRARLNAMRKAISDRRIEVKKAIMAPYEIFEAEVKEIVALIDKPIAMIDAQISEYEERVKLEKKEALQKHFEDVIGSLEGIIAFNRIFDSKWLNASVSLKTAKEAITDRVTRIQTDLNSIESFCEEKYQTAAKRYYLDTLDVTKALAEAKRLKELDMKIEEEKERKAEEERKAQEELERQKKAEEERLQTPHIRGCVTGKNPNGTCACCGHNGVQCCSECNEDCNGRCGWYEEEKPEHDTDRAVEVTEPQTCAEEAKDPFVKQEEKKYKTSFTVFGTMEQIMSVKKFMEDNNIKFGKVER